MVEIDAPGLALRPRLHVVLADRSGTDATTTQLPPASTRREIG